MEAASHGWVVEIDNDLACDIGDSTTHALHADRVSLPLQKGFIITSRACMEYFRLGRSPPEDFEFEVYLAVRSLEKATAASFEGLDDLAPPLLLSLYTMQPSEASSCQFHNIGMTATSMNKMASITGKYQFWLATYARHLRAYGCGVLAIPYSEYQQVDIEYLDESKESSLGEVPISLLQCITADYKEVTFRAESDKPCRQLLSTIYNIMNSMSEEDIPDTDSHNNAHGLCFLNSSIMMGVTINCEFGAASGRGIVYSRNPSTGEKLLCCEYYECSDDCKERMGTVAAPLSIQQLSKTNTQLFHQCQRMCKVLEEQYHDVQTIEFEVENRRLFVVKSWASDRSADASLKISLDLVNENAISVEEAIIRIQPAEVNLLVQRDLLAPPPESTPTVTAEAPGLSLMLGYFTAVAGGIAAGKLVTYENDSPEEGEGYIVLLKTCKSIDLTEKILSAKGFLCLGGGMSSTLARYARKHGKPMICACSHALKFNMFGELIAMDQTKLNRHEVVSLDGYSGAVCLGDNRSSFKDPPSSLSMIDDVICLAKPYNSADAFGAVQTPTEVSAAWKVRGVVGVAVLNTEEVLLMSHVRQAYTLWCWMIAMDSKLSLCKTARNKVSSQVESYLVKFFSDLFEKGSQELKYFVRLIHTPRPPSDVLSSEYLPQLRGYIEECVCCPPRLTEPPVDLDKGTTGYISELLSLQVSAIRTAILNQPTGMLCQYAPSGESQPRAGHEGIFQVCLAVGSGSECFEAPTILHDMQLFLLQQLKNNQTSPLVSWGIGYVLEVPAACFKCSINIIPLMALCEAGIRVFIYFDVDKLLPLLLGLPNCSVLRAGTSSAYIERSGILSLLRNTVEAVRAIPGGSYVKFGVIGMESLSTSYLSRLNCEIQGSTIITPLDEAVGAVVAGAQVCLLSGGLLG